MKFGPPNVLGLQVLEVVQKRLDTVMERLSDGGRTRGKNHNLSKLHLISQTLIVKHLPQYNPTCN